MDSVHHIWCPLSSQEYQDLPDGAETTLTPEIMKYKVMSTPAVVIDDIVVHTGGIPSKDMIESWL
nr:thioredoxin family protein [Klebsiella variicola]